MSLLGVDVGAGACVAAAFAADGTLLAQAQRDYQPLRGAEGVYELDAHQVWAAVREAIAAVAEQVRADPIQALSISSIGEALVPLGADGRITGRALLDIGDQARPYLHELEGQLGTERVYDLTRHLPGPRYWLPKLCWLRDKQPEQWQRASIFVSLSGLMCSLLGGSSASDYSLASSTLLLDAVRGEWSPEMLAACRIPQEKLPRLAPATTPVGTVAPAVGRALGLSPRVRLLLGGHTHACQALGAGVIRSGMSLYGMTGHAYMIPTFQAVPLISLMREHGLDAASHVIPDLFTTRLHNPSGGLLLRWFRDQLAPLERRLARRRGANPYDVLLAEMPDAPTSLLVLPHLASPERAGGPPTSGAVLGLTLGTTRGEIVRALLEGMTLYLAAGQDALERSGVRVTVYRSIGEGSRSHGWQQLTADVLGVSVERTAHADAAPLGAALLAGMGSGAYRDAEAAVEAAVRVEHCYEPDAARHAVYRQRLSLYREVDALLTPYLGALRTQHA
jgi:xylulokinase